MRNLIIMPQAQNRVRMSLNDYAEEAAVVNEQSAKPANANRFIEANTQEVTLYRKHSKKCTFYTLRFGCSFAAVNTIKPQLL